jgi:hypothetical protein
MAIELLGISGNKVSVSVDTTKKEILVGASPSLNNKYGKIGEISSWDEYDFQNGDKPFEINVAKHIHRAQGMLKNTNAPIRIVAFNN